MSPPCNVAADNGAEVPRASSTAARCARRLHDRIRESARTNREGMKDCPRGRCMTNSDAAAASATRAKEYTSPDPGVDPGSRHCRHPQRDSKWKTRANHRRNAPNKRAKTATCARRKPTGAGAALEKE